MDEIDLTDYARINKEHGDSRVAFHEKGYELEKFDDPDHLSTVVRFDLPLLGNVRGCAVCTCSATSAPTPCHSPAWVRR